MRTIRSAANRLRMTSWHVLAVLGTAMLFGLAGYWVDVLL